MLDEALSSARSHVKHFTIPKRNGKNRIIYQPSKKLKTIQYWLLINILNKLPVHDSAIAYRRDNSILDNAKIHRDNKYFVKMDFKNFFPSIKWKDLELVLEKWSQAAGVSCRLDAEDRSLIRKACFYKEDILPIGYPSSPTISNVVMFSFDMAVSQSLNDTDKYGNAIYTRYADDIIISTNKKNIASEVIKIVTHCVSESVSPRISINTEKTKKGSSSGGSAMVTGLKVCENGHITIHRKQKDHIRLLLSLFKRGDLKEEEKASLLGHLAYTQYVAPNFYSKLQNKYFKEIKELRESGL